MTQPADRTSLNSEQDQEAKRQEQIRRNQPLIALLESWLEEEDGSPEESEAEFQRFIRAFDEDRGERKIFEQYYR